MKYLILVESPNKEKTITSLLKGTKYEDSKVMGTKGHLLEILDDRKSFKNSGVYPNKDFAINYGVRSDQKKRIEELKKAVEQAQKIYVCSDPDREGELIAWSAIKTLKLPKTKTVRAVFNEITKKAVIEGLDNPRPLDENLVYAAQARGAADKLIGYSLSPIARAHVSAMSVGRCQSAGLKILALREEEIENFVPEEYYELILHFSKEKELFTAKYCGKKGTTPKKIKELEECLSIKKECNGDYIIEDIIKKVVKESPTAPYTTSSFLQDAARICGLSSESATSAAQSLFEGINIMGEHKGLITYIRTDDSRMSPEFTKELRHFVKSNYGEKYLGEVVQGKAGKNAQEAHEAIHPCDINITPAKIKEYITNPLLIKVYTLIWSHTVQSTMKPALINVTQYVINNNGHKFVFSSRELQFDGYRKVKVADKTAEKEEIVKATFEINEVLKNTSLAEEKKTTTPPARYREDTFQKALETNGIGRPSTYNTIIQTLLDAKRNYCRKDQKNFVLTDKGVELSKFLDKHFSDLICIDYTSLLEEKLDKIAHGDLSYLDFMKELFSELQKNLNEFQEFCPECGYPLVQRRGAYGPFISCSNYPNCKYHKSIFIKNNTNNTYKKKGK